MKQIEGALACMLLIERIFQQYFLRGKHAEKPSCAEEAIHFILLFCYAGNIFCL